MLIYNQSVQISNHIIPLSKCQRSARACFILFFRKEHSGLSGQIVIFLKKHVTKDFGVSIVSSHEVTFL